VSKFGEAGLGLRFYPVEDPDIAGFYRQVQSC
jgi:hypothetical protein